MSTERLPEVEMRLSGAIESRGLTYINKEAVIFYFENDDTDAHRDAYTLKGCLEDIFGIKSTIIEISKRDSSPAFTIRDTLNQMYHRMAPSRHALPSLMIMGYVGHSAVDNASGMVKFVGGDGLQKVLWRFIARQWFSDDETLENVDSFAILDCCYSGATREKHPRTSQVLAACGADETARSRRAGFISFSQRFSAACHSLAAREPQSFITTDAIYHELCRLRPTDAPEPRIIHLGSSGRLISLPLQVRTVTDFPRPLNASSEYQLLVKLSVGGERDEDSKMVANKFQKTLENLLSEYKVEVISAYESK